MSEEKKHNRFFIYAKEQGGKFYHIYIDDDGVEHQEIIKDYDLRLFKKSNIATGFKSIFGDDLAEIKFSNIRDFKNFYKENHTEMQIFGMDDPLIQFLSNEYDISDGAVYPDKHYIRVLNFDIETECSPDLPFPSYKNPINAIVSISCKMFGIDKYVTFGLHEYRKRKREDIYVKCTNERELLRRFIDYIQYCKPHAFTGWNIDGFDIPYLVERMNRVLGEEYTKKLSLFPNEWNAISVWNDEYSILGINTLDYMKIYKKYQLGEKLETYRLDFVGQYEGVGGKIEYLEKYGSLHQFYVQNFQEFIEYNERDVEVVEGIDDVRGYIDILMLVCFQSLIGIESYQSPTKSWDATIYNALKAINVQVSPNPRRGSDNRKAKGAYVKEPIIGRGGYIVGFDAKALYPTILEQFNISPETVFSYAGASYDNNLKYIKMVDDIEIPHQDLIDAFNNKTEPTVDLPKEFLDTINPVNPDFITTANGLLIKKDIDGIIPQLINKKSKIRTAQKKIYNSANAEMEDLKAHYTGDDLDAKLSTLFKKSKLANAVQHAMKIDLNSLYGALLEKGFRWYRLEMGEAVTSTGKFMNMSASNKVNYLFNTLLNTKGVDYVIYMDTDSIYVAYDAIVEKIAKGVTDINEITDIIDDFNHKVVTPYFDRVFKVIQKLMNTNISIMDMKRESIADKYYFAGKKRYALRVIDMEGTRYAEPKLKYTGLENVQSVTPKFWKVRIERAIDIIFNHTESDYIDLYQDSYTKYMQLSLHEMAVSNSVNSLVLTKGVMPNVKGSVAFNEYINKNGLAHLGNIEVGDKVKWVYMKNKNNKFGSDSLAYKTEDDLKYLDVDINDVDLERMFEKFGKALKTIAKNIGWSTSHIDRLNNIEVPF